MHFPYKSLLVAILGTLTGFLGIVQIVLASPMERASTQVAQVQIKTISAVLPNQTEVMLKGSGSKFGKLSAIDPKGGQLTLVLENGRSESIDISRIEKIVFRSVNPVTGKPLGPIQGEQRTWSGVSLSNLKIQANGSRMEVRLPCAVDSKVCQERGTSYTVEELSFSDSSKVSLSISVAK